MEVDLKVKEPEGRKGNVLRQMGMMLMLCSTRLPWQQAQNDSLESRCDKSNITPRDTGAWLSYESALVCQTMCVNGVWVVVGGLSVLWGKM